MSVTFISTVVSYWSTTQINEGNEKKREEKKSKAERQNDISPSSRFEDRGTRYMWVSGAGYLGLRRERKYKDGILKVPGLCELMSREGGVNCQIKVKTQYRIEHSTTPCWTILKDGFWKEREATSRTSCENHRNSSLIVYSKIGNSRRLMNYFCDSHSLFYL
jgi:hypothetical protein